MTDRSNRPASEGRDEPKNSPVPKSVPESQGAEQRWTVSVCACGDLQEHEAEAEFPSVIEADDGTILCSECEEPFKPIEVVPAQRLTDAEQEREEWRGTAIEHEELAEQAESQLSEERIKYEVRLAESAQQAVKINELESQLQALREELAEAKRINEFDIAVPLREAEEERNEMRQAWAESNRVIGRLRSAVKQHRNATESRLRLLDSRGEAEKSMLKPDRDLYAALDPNEDDPSEAAKRGTRQSPKQFSSQLDQPEHPTPVAPGHPDPTSERQSRGQPEGEGR
jgi:DNA repair exonuclease SbcCD ATPase subunit